MPIFLSRRVDYKDSFPYISGKFVRGDCPMELSRKIGIGIVMMIPTFVISGLFWDLSHSWILVFIVIGGMILLYKQIITGKIKALFKNK